MNRRRAFAPTLSALALVAAAHEARAWESQCYEYSDPTQDTATLASQSAPACNPSYGPGVTRQRWLGPLDEHRQLFEHARKLAGGPDALGRTLLLRVFAGDNAVSVGGRIVPSIAPVAFDSATRAVTRATSLGELAELPDYSYALWDWASGNETCPLAGVGDDPEACHDFASHMGPVNSNHFLPQAGEFYARTHALALARAAECHAARDAMGADATRFAGFVDACEDEALAIEAVAQHYLQDAWSSGHMWQRWGGPEITDFPGDTPEEKRSRAVLVALAAGLIHGSRGVLQRLPSWSSYDVDDPLCAPRDEVQFVSLGEHAHAAGDDYLADLFPGGGDGGPTRFASQHDKLLRCGAAGIAAVYRTAGENRGALDPSAAAQLDGVDPTSAACLGQRAVNTALLVASGIDLKFGGAQITLPLDARVSSVVLPVVAVSQADATLNRRLVAQFRADLMRATAVARVLARTRPDGTDSADGALGEFMGAQPNGTYAGRGGVASYSDPTLPWPATTDATVDHGTERALVLARVFHRAHAADWCAAMTAQDLIALVARARDATLSSETHAAACEVCEEFVARHLRVGTPASYDTTREPVCHFLAPQPAYVYGATDARAYCGC